MLLFCKRTNKCGNQAVNAVGVYSFDKEKKRDPGVLQSTIRELIKNNIL